MALRRTIRSRGSRGGKEQGAFNYSIVLLHIPLVYYYVRRTAGGEEELLLLLLRRERREIAKYLQFGGCRIRTVIIRRRLRQRIIRLTSGRRERKG